MEHSLQLGRKISFPPGKYRFVSYKADESQSSSIDSELKKNIKLVISLINIKAIDKNYRVKLYLNKKNSPQFIGQTEGINGNPILFSRSFDLVYFFEKQQNIIFEIEENSKSSVDVYRINTNLAKIINYGKMNKSIPIMSSNKTCYEAYQKSEQDVKKFELKVDWFTIEESNKTFNLEIEMIDTRNIDIKKDEKYFYVLSNKLDGKNFRYLYKSEEIHCKCFKFDLTEISSLDLCLNDVDKEIKMEFYRLDDPSNGKSSLLGVIIGRIKKLLCEENKFQNILSNLDVKKTIGVVKIDLNQSQDSNETSVLNLIKKHNLNINLSIAIDFTNSNGDPSDDTSLHYKYGKTANPYKKAIYSIGKNIGEYDSDKKFPVYGFGAKIIPEEYVNHCFNINLNPNDPNIFGINEVIKTYENIFDHIILFGPTMLSDVLGKIFLTLEEERKCEKNSKLKNYHILLILTDGIIDDMIETKDYIVKLSNYPISIIIVGIGQNDDFENMEILDGDNEPLVDSNGILTSRDIVQFVKFDDFQNDEVKLTEKVLEEIPMQIMEYFSLEK